ncbi:MAG: hypothetical protein EXS13_15095 [Planctomycetes bacterium]|nr:hypothetical protein [Planctomycetota bacterium]
MTLLDLLILGSFEAFQLTEAPPAAPPLFVENRGQLPADVRLFASLRHETLLVHDDGFTLRALAETAAAEDHDGVRGINVSIRARDAAAQRAVGGRDRSAALHHFLRGRDPARWVTQVPSFLGAVVKSLHPGIDLILRDGGGQFEYDLELAPGADLAALVFDVDGATGIDLAEDGSLIISTALGELHQSPPQSFAIDRDGARRAVTTPVRLVGPLAFGFDLRETLADETLLIDPGLAFVSYFGGTLADRAYDVVTAEDGVVTIAGRGLSLDLPTTPGAFDTAYNGDSPSPEPIGDCWVARFAADGTTLLWSTYLGGALNDHAQELAIAANGDVVVSGWTISTDFPTTPGCYDDSYNGGGGGLYLGGDVYATRIASSGAALVASTLIGGSDLEYAIGLALAADESVLVTGHVHSNDFPTTPGCWQPTTTDHAEIFVSKLSSDLTTLVASTYFGGNAEEYSDVILIAPDGTITIAGSTNSSNLPTTPGVIDSTYDGGDTSSHRLEGFVASFDALLTTRLACTYLGRSGTDSIYGGARHPDGSLLVCGETRSTNFPVTTGAYDTTHGGAFDGFIAKLSADLTTLHWSTFLGGDADERISSVVPHRSGHVVFAGRSYSTTWPTTPGCYDATLSAAPDGVFGRLDRDGSQLHYSSYIGGSSYDVVHDIVVDGRAAALLAGETSSSNFPATPGAFDTSYNTKVDGWVGRCDLLPTGAERFGASTPGCEGMITITIDGMAQGGGDTVVGCENGLASTTGWLGVSFGALDTPISIAGIDLWIDPNSSLFILLPVTTEPTGYSELELHAGNGLVGVLVALQWFWIDPCGPQGITASDALAVTVQP